MKRISALLVGLFLIISARAETITVMSYNVELFHDRFASATQPSKKDNDTKLTAVAKVIQTLALNPDILCIEECCEQDELDRFNKEWLKGAYETVIVFPTNSDRHQQLGLMLKPGFKVIERKDQYYLEKDSVKNPRGDRLFARGPGFALVQAPSGYQFWIGVTHEKSRADNSLEVTKWRDREATRLHEIVKELEKSGKGNGDVLLCGDMNDELGFQEFEQEAGGDSTAIIVGPPEDGLTLVDKPLIEKGKISYWRGRFKSFIDHIIVTPEMKDQVKEINVYDDPSTHAASDHYPLVLKFDADPVVAK